MMPHSPIKKRETRSPKGHLRSFMLGRIPAIVLIGLLLALASACTNKKVQNPLANVGSKQPDKVLFDRAMDALKHNRFDVARMTLQTLINTYPDSEFIARAKLAVADSWYDEGGSTALTQAEIEYKDFITFFPNMPEAAEAQFKIANIHYQQMEKPDRDFTHAMRAEEEYRQMILQFPDSKLVPEAKQRLLEVQEVLAEREFRVGRFYYLRQSYPAAIARLRTVSDRYPLYSQADEVLFLLGESYEGQINRLRAVPTCTATSRVPGCVAEDAKSRAIEEFTKGAADAYSKILSRYPVMTRADDAKHRLLALHRPVPKPTKAAVAQNKAEEASRHETGMFGRMMGNFQKHPDVAQATKVGDPTLVDPNPVSATEVVQQAARAMSGSTGATSDNNKVAGEIVGTGATPVGEAVPRSDTAPAGNTAAGSTPETTPRPATDTIATPAASTAAPAVTDNSVGQTPVAGELKPNVPQDSNELKPNVAPDASQGSQPLTPPPQVNEIQNGNTSQAGQASDKGGDAASSSRAEEEASPADISSSKRKKKKGLHKIVPF
jgi:outer membrane protein assembly factor BamD